MYELLPCPNCGDFEPMVYAEGNAKKIFNKDGTENFYFTNVIGYMCECQKCGACTDYHMIAQDAVGAWNNGKVKVF